jgi:hypothetical protein
VRSAVVSWGMFIWQYGHREEVLVLGCSLPGVPYFPMAPSIFRLCAVACTLPAFIEAAVTVNSTLLVLSRETNATASGVSVLQGYGIPYQVVDLSIPAAGFPQLNSTPNAGNFGGIVAVSARPYNGGDDWSKVLSEKQWQELYRYQEAFGVRMVRLNAWPSADFGVQSAGGAVTADQPVAITNVKDFATANIIA